MIRIGIKKKIRHVISVLYHIVVHWNKLQFYPSCYVSIKSRFEGANKIYPHTIFNGYMGYGSYIQKNCDIDAKIGRFTSIGPYVRTNSGIHPYSYPHVTTSPMFYSINKQSGETFSLEQKFVELLPVPIIGNDCWIGENVFIGGGVIIGDGAVILAGAVVTKSIPPYAVAGGVPAKIIKYRYDEETIKWLLNLRWWENDINNIKSNCDYFCRFEDFCLHFSKSKKR